METSSQLLAEMLLELKRINQPQDLGFVDPPFRRRIYCNTQYGTSMYFWDGEKKAHEPIQKNGIACIVEAAEVVAKDFKGVDQEKLFLNVMADKPYTLVFGLETNTTKSLLRGLLKADLNLPLTITFATGQEENALFCNVIQSNQLLKSDSDRKLGDITKKEIISAVLRLQKKLGQTVQAAETAA